MRVFSACVGIVWLAGAVLAPAQVVPSGAAGTFELVNIPYNAANFTTDGNKAWTVQEADQINLAVLTVGKMRLVNFWLSNTDVGAGSTGTELRIALPFTAAKNAIVVPNMVDNGAFVTSPGRCFTQVGWTYIACRTPTDSVWVTGTGVASVRGQLWIEAQ